MEYVTSTKLIKMCAHAHTIYCYNYTKSDAGGDQTIQSGMHAQT